MKHHAPNIYATTSTGGVRFLTRAATAAEAALVLGQPAHQVHDPSSQLNALTRAGHVLTEEGSSLSARLPILVLDPACTTTVELELHNNSEGFTRVGIVQARRVRRENRTMRHVRALAQAIEAAVGLSTPAQNWINCASHMRFHALSGADPVNVAAIGFAAYQGHRAPEALFSLDETPDCWLDAAELVCSVHHR